MLLLALLLQEIWRYPLVYSEGGEAIQLLDDLLDLALVLEDGIDEGAFGLDLAFSVGHDFGVEGNFVEDLLGLYVGGEVLDDNGVPVLVVEDLLGVGVGVFEVKLELLLGIVLLDKDEVAANEGLVELLDGPDGVLAFLVGDKANAIIGLIINLETGNRAKRLKGGAQGFFSEVLGQVLDEDVGEDALFLLPLVPGLVNLHCHSLSLDLLPVHVSRSELCLFGSIILHVGHAARAAVFEAIDLAAYHTPELFEDPLELFLLDVHLEVLDN